MSDLAWRQGSKDLNTETTQWLTTAPNPSVRSQSADAGQRGWRTHAVAATKAQTLHEVRFVTSACGIMAAHGWDMDLFIDRPCARCLVKLGLACMTCKGTRGVGKVRDNTHRTCPGCHGSGLRK